MANFPSASKSMQSNKVNMSSREKTRKSPRNANVDGSNGEAGEEKNGDDDGEAAEFGVDALDRFLEGKTVYVRVGSAEKGDAQ